VARKKREKPAPEPEPTTPPEPEPTLPELSGKHRQTLDALFVRPERANIAWNDFTSMMEAAGAMITAKGGSAHSFVLVGLSPIKRSLT
jgi:hypothetical protein